MIQLKAPIDSHDVYATDVEKASVEYIPSPLTRALIPKSKPGEYREIFMPEESDKYYQRKHLLPMLNESIDPHLADNSFAYRKGISIENVIELLEKLVDKGYNLVYKVDVCGYFNNIDREILYEQMEPIVPEKWREETKRSLEVPYKYKGTLKYPKKGIYQGTPVSGTLANLYLTELDESFQGQDGVFSIRYSDDILLIARGRKKLEKAITKLKKEIRRKGLWCKWDEARISNLEEKEITYLGLRISKRGRKLRVKESQYARENLKMKLLEAYSETEARDIIRSRLYHYTVGGRYPGYLETARKTVEEVMGKGAWNRIVKEEWIKIPYGEWSDIKEQ